MESALTDRQLRFVFEYLQDLNASAAAVRAGYSEKTRASQASELMRNPAVQALIRSELQGLLAELRCSALELMKERMRAAFFRADKMFGAGWEVLPLDEMDEETRAALQVSAVMTKRGPTLRVKQPDRDKALRALERVHERLDRLNEQYWAKLEREGKVPSLAEIDAMDGGAEMPAGDFSEKPQVLSGSGMGADGLGVNFPDKTQVLSGSEEGVGCRTAPPSSELRTGLDKLRTNGMSAEFLEKPQVLSGSGIGADVLAAISPDKTQVLSGWTGAGCRTAPPSSELRTGFDRLRTNGVGGEGGGGLPRPQASPWLLQGGAPGGAARELALAA